VRYLTKRYIGEYKSDEGEEEEEGQNMRANAEAKSQQTHKSRRIDKMRRQMKINLVPDLYWPPAKKEVHSPSLVEPLDVPGHGLGLHDGVEVGLAVDQLTFPRIGENLFHAMPVEDGLRVVVRGHYDGALAIHLPGQIPGGEHELGGYLLAPIGGVRGEGEHLVDPVHFGVLLHQFRSVQAVVEDVREDGVALRVASQ